MAERNRKNGMVNRQRKKDAVAEEYGEPFWGVVRGFAEQGNGKVQTARILGWSEKAFLRMLKTEDPGIKWPTIKEQCAARPLHRPADIGERISEGIRRARAKS